MTKQSKWAEIGNDYIEDADEGFHVLHIDAWKTSDDDEEATVIAKLIGINKDGAPHVYLSYQDTDAPIDPLAQKAIREADEKLRDYLKQKAKEQKRLVQKRKQPRYRYEVGGLLTGSDPISRARLFSGTGMPKSYHGSIALRICIPEDLDLTNDHQKEYFAANGGYKRYSTTSDTRTLDELGYDVIVRDETKGKWVVRNEFKGKCLNEIAIYTMQGWWKLNSNKADVSS
ncbi:hypothetical protein CHH61_04110 [Shouchella clausii]|uniref:Uncharacterized protein n=1 Tax=Shouchella clausii TaxID=79880 RepID=A0A268S496_SHOCL|nr:hypothetical protein [Shouchella clausii]PAF27320.1 hypothetical protein CHH61_04110 [Shouchella clausii]